jgi:hypothetical protein
MAVYKRGGHWLFTKTINGVRYRGAFKTARTKAQAEEAERKKLQEIHEGVYGKPKGSAIFIEVAEKIYLPWSKENKRSTSDKYYVEVLKRSSSANPSRSCRLCSLRNSKARGERRQRKRASPADPLQ